MNVDLEIKQTVTITLSMDEASVLSMILGLDSRDFVSEGFGEATWEFRRDLFRSLEVLGVPKVVKTDAANAAANLQMTRTGQVKRPDMPPLQKEGGVGTSSRRV